MKTTEIFKLIEKFAPLETQEAWDNSGLGVDCGEYDIKKVLLSLTVTEEIINQAKSNNCDLIVAHHPLFCVPLSFNKGISIYSAHTNLDKASGGTTDTLIEVLGFDYSSAKKVGDFLRVIDLHQEISLQDFITNIKSKLGLDNIRIVNNLNLQKIKRIAFCSGSGGDFIDEAEKIGADVFITGDLKYHSVVESKIIIVDAGHFETEFPVLSKIREMLEKAGIEVLIADEKSPFINY